MTPGMNFTKNFFFYLSFFKYSFFHNQVSNYLIIDIHFIRIHYSISKTLYEKCEINEENEDESLICKEVGPKKLCWCKAGYVVDMATLECLKGIYCFTKLKYRLNLY